MSPGADFTNLRLSSDGDVSTIVLDRPGHINAFTTEMYREIRQAVRMADADASTSVIVLRAEGDVFGVGGDLNEMLTYLDEAEPGGNAYLFQDDLPFAAVRACQKPTVAEIQGICVGGGFGLAVACDVVIAAEGTRVGIPEAKVGLIDGLAIAALYGHMPQPALRYLLFSGSLIDAAEALRLGLILECVPAAALAERVSVVAAEFAASSSRAIREYKRILRSYDRPNHMDELMALMLSDPDVAEQIRARFGANRNGS